MNKTQNNTIRNWFIIACSHSFLLLTTCVEMDGLKTPERSDLLSRANWRPVEGRIAGKKDHQTWRPESIQTIDLSHLQICSEIEDLLPAKKDSEDAETQGYRAILALLRQNPGEAVSLLEKAIIRSDDPAHFNDLAVAKLALAEREDNILALIDALEAIEHANELAPDLPEVRFNRALIHEKLNLWNEALDAWVRYLSSVQEEGWILEGRTHLEKLEQKKNTARFRQWSHASPKAFESISPQKLRESALVRFLPAWANAYLEGDQAKAKKHLEIVRNLGKFLFSKGEARTVARAVEEIDLAHASSDVNKMTHLALGYLSFGAGYKKFQNSDYLDAQSDFEQVKEHLRSDHPLAIWALAQLAGIEMQLGHTEQAEHQLKTLLNDDRSHEYPSLRGREAWLLGLLYLRAGALTLSLPRYQEAATLYLRVQEDENLGAIESMLAENFSYLGLNTQAWQHRANALDLLTPHQQSFRLHNLLLETAQTAYRLGACRAAMTLQNECVRVAHHTGEPETIAEALLWRTRFTGNKNDLRGIADLSLALGKTHEIADPSVKARSVADVQMAEAITRQDIVLFDQATTFYREHNLTLNKASNHLNRARILMAQGKWKDAEADLSEAIESYEQRDRQFDDEILRLSHLEPAQDLYDAMIEFQLRILDKPETAFFYAERARTGPRLFRKFAGTTEDAPTPKTMLKNMQQVMPHNAVLISYTLLKDELLVWTLSRRHGLNTIPPTAISRELLNGKVRRLFERMQNRETKHQITQSSTELFRMLVAPLQKDIPIGATLIFLPDKGLNALPFAALINPENGRYLLEDHPIGVVPSMAHFHRALIESEQQSRTNWRALCVGNPDFDRTLFPWLDDLAEVRQEIDFVNSLYPSALPPLLGKAAQKHAILEGLHLVEMFHFAGHAMGNDEQPENAFLILAKGLSEHEPNVLYAHEIYKCRFEQLRLVVLSTCNALQPNTMRTTGLAGMARPFLSSGAEAVLASLWLVDDRPTTRLMMLFQEQIVLGVDGFEALRNAQLALLADPEPSYHKPAAWAPFQLVGALSSP